MTPEDIELMQEKIVLLCNAAGRFGLPEDRIKRTLLASGYGIDAEALEKQLAYLESKGFIMLAEKDLRPDRRRWRTTYQGDEYLMRQGLI